MTDPLNPGNVISAAIGSDADTSPLQPTKLFPQDYDISLQETEAYPVIKDEGVPLRQTKGNNTLAHLNADVQYSGLMLMVALQEPNLTGKFQVLSLKQKKMPVVFEAEGLDTWVVVELFDPLVGKFTRTLPWWTEFSLWLGQP